jgi:hypothetical protein
MTTNSQARDGADAVRRFNRELGALAPDRIQVRLDGRDGLARLCEMERALSALWPEGAAKELIWLGRGPAAEGEQVHLRAFSADGATLAAATYRLAPPD